MRLIRWKIRSTFTSVILHFISFFAPVSLIAGWGEEQEVITQHDTRIIRPIFTAVEWYKLSVQHWKNTLIHSFLCSHSFFQQMAILKFIHSYLPDHFHVYFLICSAMYMQLVTIFMLVKKDFYTTVTCYCHIHYFLNEWMNPIKNSPPMLNKQEIKISW